MKSMQSLSITALLIFLLCACSGVPVQLGTRTSTPPPSGTARNISAKACGFQLLIAFPIQVNSRQARAYQYLLAQAGGDFVTDVEIKEAWYYGFVGTTYCTTIQAKAIRPNS